MDLGDGVDVVGDARFPFDGYCGDSVGVVHGQGDGGDDDGRCADLRHDVVGHVVGDAEGLGVGADGCRSSGPLWNPEKCAVEP